MLVRLAFLFFISVGLGCATTACDNETATSRATSRPTTNNATPVEVKAGTAVATFAGGCFWCMEKPFEKLDGVSAVISGYTSGHQKNPTYKEVCAGTTGHAEAIQVHYNPNVISYEDLLEVFWRQIDPTDAGGQYVDRGTQYRSEIYVENSAERKIAQASKKRLAESKRFNKAIVTQITDSTIFYPAEEYHQDYYLKEPAHYSRYRSGSGRDRFLDRVWGAERHYKPKKKKLSFTKPSKAELKSNLTAIQYYVTQEDGTERPFQNEFHDNKRKGLYLDIVSGEVLFSSTHKFDSGTGWPSFWQPVASASIVNKVDHKLGVARTEVRSKLADSHLGHVFNDGPKPTGLRYCINSAALRFVPVEDFQKEGLQDFAHLFEK